MRIQVKWNPSGQNVMKNTCFHNQLGELPHGNLAQVRHPGKSFCDGRTTLTNGLFSTDKKHRILSRRPTTRRARLVR